MSQDKIINPPCGWGTMSGGFPSDGGSQCGYRVIPPPSQVMVGQLPNQDMKHKPAFGGLDKKEVMSC